MQNSLMLQEPCFLMQSLASPQELGGSHFHEALDADEVDGLEEAIERWVAGLWAPLRRAMAATGAPAPQVTEPGPVPGQF